MKAYFFTANSYFCSFLLIFIVLLLGGACRKFDRAFDIIFLKEIQSLSCRFVDNHICLSWRLALSVGDL